MVRRMAEENRTASFIRNDLRMPKAQSHNTTKNETKSHGIISLRDATRKLDAAMANPPGTFW